MKPEDQQILDWPSNQEQVQIDVSSIGAEMFSPDPILFEGHTGQFQSLPETFLTNLMRDDL